MGFLSTLINDAGYRHHHLLVFQSSISQSSLPLLHHIVAQFIRSKSDETPCRNLVFCLLYPPAALLAENPSEYNKVYNWLDRVPGYSNYSNNNQEDILSAMRSVPSQFRVNVVIDSLNTLSSDIGSVAKTYNFLREALAILQSRPNPSRLILHVVQPHDLIRMITQTSFSSSIAHLVAHPTALIHHLATEFFTFPPPVSPSAKFWGVFIPISERDYDADRIVFGNNGEGSGDTEEFVVEVINREAGGGHRKRGIERSLEGWSAQQGVGDWIILEKLKKLSQNPTKAEIAPDPTKDVSFNLSITSSQQESRARVPLPYAHEGKPLENQTTTNKSASIFYDPDSADDIDDDDPDDDLDI